MDKSARVNDLPHVNVSKRASRRAITRATSAGRVQMLAKICIKPHQQTRHSLCNKCI